MDLSPPWSASGQQKLNRFGAVRNVSEGFGPSARTGSAASLTNEHRNRQTFGEKPMFRTSKPKLAHATVVAGTISLLLSSSALAGLHGGGGVRSASFVRAPAMARVTAAIHPSFDRGNMLRATNGPAPDRFSGARAVSRAPFPSNGIAGVASHPQEHLPPGISVLKGGPSVGGNPAPAPGIAAYGVTVAIPPAGKAAGQNGSATLGTVQTGAATSGNAPIGNMNRPIVIGSVWNGSSPNVGGAPPVPVRVTAFSVSEEVYDSTLNPTRAKVQIPLGRGGSASPVAIGGRAAGGSLNPSLPGGIRTVVNRGDAGAVVGAPYTVTVSGPVTLNGPITSNGAGAAAGGATYTGTLTISGTATGGTVPTGSLTITGSTVGPAGSNVPSGTDAGGLGGKVLVNQGAAIAGDNALFNISGGTILGNLPINGGAGAAGGSVPVNAGEVSIGGGAIKVPNKGKTSAENLKVQR
jgi:hypothetical protein